MNFNQSLILIAVVGIHLLVSCGLLEPRGNGIPDSIDNFVQEYSFPKQQKTRISFSDEEKDVYIFNVLYGDGMDCPSGCIYSRILGLKVENHIGWLWGDFYTAFDSSEYEYFDVNASDSTLFDQDLWDEMYDEDYWIFINQVLPTIARDIDTPVEVLLWVSERLYDRRIIGVADLLIANPVAIADTLILQSMACLPDVHLNTYDDAREIARLMLGDDFNGCN